MSNRIEEHKIASHSTTTPDSNFAFDLSKRIPELDGLRGLAIGMVVFMHCVWVGNGDSSSHFLNYVSMAARPFWSAVDLFFVLSGFLIGGNLLDARTSQNYFSTFYIRRFCRVLPIYLLFIGLVGASYQLIYLRVGGPLDWLYAGKIPWYAYLSFGQNFWMAKGNYWGPSILAVTWAFAVEVQFYLIVPAIIRFVRRSALPYVFVAGFVIAPIIRTYLGLHFQLFATYVLLPSRMDSLFLGLLCAYLLREQKKLNWFLNHQRRIWAVLLVLVAGIPLVCTYGIPYTLLWVLVGYGWTALLYAAVLILAVTNSRCFISRALRWKWLRGFGTISYGVYLFHYLVYGLCMWLFGLQRTLPVDWKDFWVACLAVAITTALASLSWVYFEKPIVRWSHKRRYDSRAQVENNVRDPNLTSESASGLPTFDMAAK
ncbi:MAG TPA: acyltransferase [Candidatus Acidoferrales bacterium]|nr:acyltransferase [Candidatus Acidoferrales bacterium]